jgi:lipopolysaccharide transport system permease protein
VSPETATRAGLIWTLVRTDFKVRYHGSAGGFLWALLKPVTMFVMLMGVFSLLFASDPNYKLNLIIGLFLWDFFAEGSKAGLGSLRSRGFLLTKARCPAWILVVTSISNAVIVLVVFIGIMLAFLVGAGHPPSAAALGLFLAYAVALVLLVVGFSLGASVLFLRYQDLNQVWDLAVQAGFFLAPVIYPLSILPERYHPYLYLWAPTPVIEFARAVLVNGTAPGAAAHAGLALAVAGSLAAGLIVYRLAGPRAAEYV